MVLLVSRIILVLLILVGIRLLARVLVPLFTPRGARPTTRARRTAPAVQRGEMFRDPVCGTWVDRRIAVTANRSGQTVHFCSNACRDRYLAGPPS